MHVRLAGVESSDARVPQRRVGAPPSLQGAAMGRFLPVKAAAGYFRRRPPAWAPGCCVGAYVRLGDRRYAESAERLHHTAGGCTRRGAAKLCIRSTLSIATSTKSVCPFAL